MFLPAIGTLPDVLCQLRILTLHIYAVQNDERMPPDLDTLVEAGGASPKATICRSDRYWSRKDPPTAASGEAVRRHSFFYMPAPPGSSPDRIVACDYGDNHRGKGRNVLYVLFFNRGVTWMKEPAFQDELAKPRNAAFAEALRAVEQGATAPGRAPRPD